MAKAKTDTTDIIIYFDIDGVLGDFDGHATARGKRKADGRVDYESIDEAWWASMPAYPEAANAVAEARKMATVVRFLTGPIPSPSCYSGKAKWLLNFEQELKGRFNILANLIICPAADKALLAGPKRILIDDNADNIAAWNAAGGIGIHHTGDWARTMASLRAATGSLRQPGCHPGPRPAP
jgi:hypothetical protein